MIELNLIILVYNRANALKRLLNSVQSALIVDDIKLNIIFSLEYGTTEPNLKIVNNFKRPDVTVNIIKNEERLGVDGHNLRAIQMCCDYDLTLILEDDHFLAMGANDYIRFLAKNPQPTAGYSLYNYPDNPNNGLPFIPIQNQNSFFLACRVSSRGLLLTKEQAISFDKWNGLNPTGFINKPVPHYLDEYNDIVWEIKFTKYLIDTNQYLLFPFQSVLTAFGEMGEHVKMDFQKFQPQSHLGLNGNILYCDMGQLFRYDAFYELEPNFFKEKITDLKVFDFEVDLTDSKKVFQSDYVLTTKPMNNALFTFGAELKPMEANVLYGIEGSGINFGLVANICDSTMKRATRRMRLRWYYNQRYSLGELFIHLADRVLNNNYFAFNIRRSKHDAKRK